MMDIDVAIENEIQRKHKLIDDFLRKQLKHVEPKIKGEITKGKLKYRGVVIVNQEIHASFQKEYYLMQRGTKIGESIIV